MGDETKADDVRYSVTLQTLSVFLCTHRSDSLLLYEYRRRGTTVLSAGSDHSITQVNATSPPPPLALLRSRHPNPSHFPSCWTSSFYTHTQKIRQEERKEKQSLKEIQRLISSILHPWSKSFRGRDLRSSPLSISELPRSSSITALRAPGCSEGRSEQTGNWMRRR